MLIVGGMNGITGSVVGTVVISLLSEILRRLEAGFALAPLHVPELVGPQRLGFAIALLVMLELRPERPGRGRS
jgi:ABC-type branched-subunit amino acid transport system permease subunit